MRIGTRSIDSEYPPYIIAELGVNHDGDPKRALELVRLAAQAGADAIKLQLFEADRLMSKSAKLAAYQKAAGETDPIEMLRRLELSIDDMAPCVALAHELGIHAIVSVFSVELVPVAERLPWDAYKTASPDIINKPLLDALAATGKPLIVSTGASTMEEVERAVKWLQPIGDRLALLQCVSCYPTPDAEASIRPLEDLRDMFRVSVGYSDHTAAESTGAVAAAIGAEILEKHFTYDTDASGPDHAASLNPESFQRYVKLAGDGRAVWWPGDTVSRHVREEALSDQRLGHRRKRVLPIEFDVRTVSRQSLTTTRALPGGHVLTRDDLTIKRPGTGIPPFELDATIGKRLARDVEADVTLTREDVE